MNARERAEERVAEYLAACEAGHAGTLDAWLVDESPAFRALAGEVHAEVADVLGALGLGGAAGRPAPSSIEFDDAGWNYELGQELGRGGNGRVLEVFDKNLERRLAMKLLAPEPDPVRAARRRARFRAEARLAGRLQHPGVVAVHELGRTPQGDDYFTMPKVEGETLGALIRRCHTGDGDWTRARLLDVLVRVAETLAYAHARQVVHRDVKPANVMVGAFGETYVLDWGLARVVASADAASEERDELPLDPGLTGRGDVVGTPAYMPPEQAGAGGRPIGVTADVYALGACLHELLTGEPPFGRESDTFEILRRLTLEGPPALDHERHRVPPELAAIRNRAMQADPARRYPSADGFARDLRAYLEGRVVAAYESGGWAELRKWVRRNRGLAGSLAAAAVAVVGGVALAVWLRAEERARSLRFLDLQLVVEASESARSLWPIESEGYTDQLAQWLAEAEQLLARAERHRAELAALDVLAETRRERRRGLDDPRWTFADRDERWRHEKLDQLVRALDDFAAVGGPRSRVAAAFERSTVLWPAAREAHAAAWRDLRAAWESSPRYAGPAPQPLDGLVPLGLDPASGLAEFALVGSGELPSAAGVAPRPEHAIVLAAVPGGTFEFGIARDADPFLFGNEYPPTPVTIEPFLIGRFELSRAQFQRLVQGPEPDSELALLPASGVSWNEAVEVLAEWGLELPTEAQWERTAELGWPWAATAGASEAERLAFADAALQPLSELGARTRDGAGFADLLGNLAEFCRDPLFADGAFDFGPGDGLPRPLGELAPERARCYVRGGHFGLVAPERPLQTIAFARPEFRMIADVGERAERYGIRVARALR